MFTQMMSLTGRQHHFFDLFWFECLTGEVAERFSLIPRFGMGAALNAFLLDRMIFSEHWTGNGNEKGGLLSIFNYFMDKLQNGIRMGSISTGDFLWDSAAINRKASKEGVGGDMSGVVLKFHKILTKDIPDNHIKHFKDPAEGLSLVW